MDSSRVNQKIEARSVIMASGDGAVIQTTMVIVTEETERYHDKIYRRDADSMGNLFHLLQCFHGCFRRWRYSSYRNSLHKDNLFHRRRLSLSLHNQPYIHRPSFTIHQWCRESWERMGWKVDFQDPIHMDNFPLDTAVNKSILTTKRTLAFWSPCRHVSNSLHAFSMIDGLLI